MKDLKMEEKVLLASYFLVVIAYGAMIFAKLSSKTNKVN